MAGGRGKAGAANRPTARKVRGYGWVRDLPDHRDLIFKATPRTIAALPERVDLTPGCPPVYAQGNLGSCTANAIAGAMEFDQIKQGLKRPFVPSRLFIYYNERRIENTIGCDCGAQLRDGIKSVAAIGACPETQWPYVESRYEEEPPPPCYRSAARHKAVKYWRLTRDSDSYRACLASGYPFVFGFSVYSSFESDRVAMTGEVPMPKRGEVNIGGHAVVAVGYDDKRRRFLVRNSWGPDWGRAGYFTMPYAYLEDLRLSADFWTIRFVH